MDDNTRVENIGELLVRGESVDIQTNVTVKQVQARIMGSMSENTKAAYRYAARKYDDWYPFASPDGYPELILYLQRRMDEGVSVATIELEYSALKTYLLWKGEGKVTDRTKLLCKQLIHAYSKERGRKKKQARAVTVEQLKDVIRYQLLENTIKNIRDRAMLLIGYAGMFRRSELSALVIGDIEMEAGGVWITLQKSKNDTTGTGFRKWIASGTSSTLYCPVQALKAWLNVRGTQEKESPLFTQIRRGGHIQQYNPLSGIAVGEIIKKHFRKQGIENVTGHSLRRGAITACVRAGAKAYQIIAKSGHRGTQMIDVYTAEADKQREDCMAGVL